MFFKRNSKSVAIDFNGEIYNVSPKKTILESLLRKGADIKYNCGSGTCKQCTFHLIEGAINKKGVPSESLACCAYPLTDLKLIQF